jgi:hypothetical protein
VSPAVCERYRRTAISYRDDGFARTRRAKPSDENREMERSVYIELGHNLAAILRCDKTGNDAEANPPGGHYKSY